MEVFSRKSYYVGRICNVLVTVSGPLYAVNFANEYTVCG